MDENEESLSLDYAASCKYREQTLAYTRHCLGLDPVPTPPSSGAVRMISMLLPTPRDEKSLSSKLLRMFGVAPRPVPQSPNLPCATFKEFGEAVHRAHSKGA